MRILVDTNILFSAILFPDSKVARVLFHAMANHEIFLSDQNVYELREVTRRKAPHKLPDIENFLAKMTYELIPAVHNTEQMIRDIKDQPILNAAIVNDLDAILTGDKDFLVLDLDRPKCMTVAEYCELEGLK